MLGPQGTGYSDLVGTTGALALTQKPQESLQMQSGTWIEGAGHPAGGTGPVKGMGSGSDRGQGWNARPPCLGPGPGYCWPALALLPDVAGRTQAGLGCLVLPECWGKCVRGNHARIIQTPACHPRDTSACHPGDQRPCPIGPQGPLKAVTMLAGQRGARHRKGGCWCCGCI